MPKILILVLSYNDGVYAELMKSQQQTWDSVEVDGVRTVYYYGGGKGWVNEKEFSAEASDAYYTMAHKCVEAMKAVNLDSFDFIWRTNSSSYICKKRLVEFAKTLPKEKCYAGWKIDGSLGYDIVSGAGFMITPDVAKILIEKTDVFFEREEDVLFAEVLFKNGIEIIDDKSRYDVGEYVLPYDTPTDRYHYKLKNGDRLHDAANFFKLHEKVK